VVDYENFAFVGFDWFEGKLRDLVGDVDISGLRDSVFHKDGEPDSEVGALEVFENEEPTGWFRNSLIENFSFMYWDAYEQPLFRDVDVGDFKERANSLFFRLRQDLFQSEGSPDSMLATWFKRYNSKLLREYTEMGWV